ncbi:kinesin light chain [Leptodontidium sp. MPI-SDFR-AT-0119]|nr:kinesin light chain [Leptodontidium sp. MPI-SDFR-AT-0119]
MDPAPPAKLWQACNSLWLCREAAAQLSAPASTRHEVFTLRTYANSTAQLLPRTLLFTILEASRTMHLLHYNNNGDFTLTEFFEGDIPKKYAILSHRWGEEEVTFKDLTDGTSKDKAGNRKMQFCGERARRDGLQYFWVDTCCIDKSNAVELQEAINSMFRWYRDTTKCYVYLPDVSRLHSNSADNSNEAWESTFRKSEWFRRGWTLQELIAPASVDFFSEEGELLGNKASLERHICEVTGIPAKALRGSRLSDFSVAERLWWAASRETFRQEDKAYSLLGIFDVNMPLIYSEGKIKAMNRLREEIDKASKGSKREDFSVTFNLSGVSDVEHFVARKTELIEIDKALSGDGSRRAVVLHGLGGIGKTQLAAAYAKRHINNYSAIFWLNIKDEDTLKQSFVKNLDEVVDTVKTWLSLPNNTRWLMIYDNYDNPKLPGKTDLAAVDIRMFIPESYQGSILITTRSSQVKIGHLIHIRKLGDVRDSLEILSTVSRREGLRSDPDAILLARELDGLPLALATAGAYLDQVASWVQLQESSLELDSYEDRTLYSTWQISFDYVKQQNDLSAKLLCFWAYFDSRDLWLELLQHSDSNDPDWVRALTKDEVGFHQAVRILTSHGLVEVDTSSQGSLYADQGKLVEAEQMYQRALQGKEKALGPEHTSTLETVNNLGTLYADQGKLVEAEQMYQRALQGYENALGPDNITTYIPALNTIFNLGILFQRQADLTKARTMFLEVLRGYEKVFGLDHAESEILRDRLCALDAVRQNKSPVEIEEYTEDLPTGPSRDSNKSPSKRHKLFRKLGLRSYIRLVALQRKISCITNLSLCVMQ